MTIDRRRLIISAAAITAGAALSSKASAQLKLHPEGPAPTPEAVFEDPAVQVIGNPKGDVTIVEWFDYQCPFCKQSFPETMQLVRQDGNIRYLMKDWPILGEESVYAAKLTLAAGAARGQALSALMATKGRLTRQTIDKRLVGAGLDPAALIEAYTADAKAIDALLWRSGDQAYAFGLNATPGYMIGTTLFPGALRDADMRQAVATARNARSG